MLPVGANSFLLKWTFPKVQRCEGKVTGITKDGSIYRYDRMLFQVYSIKLTVVSGTLALPYISQA